MSSFDTKSDPVKMLPVDEAPPTDGEVYILNKYFRTESSGMEKLLDGSQEIILVGILYLLISLPMVDMYIQKYIPATNSSLYVLYGVKALILMLLFFVIRNWGLVRK